MSATSTTRRRPAAAGAALLSTLLLLAACSANAEPAHDAAKGEPTSVTTTGLVDVDGRQIYVDCPPAPGPTVVFLHGAGGQGSDWAQVVERLTDVRTCWYDRFNVGGSGADDRRHDPLESVEDLHALLSAVGAEPPYLLVGHSFGGLLALMYAGTYPDEVSGLVLADATLPFETDLDPPGTADEVRAEVNGYERGLNFYAGYREARALENSLPDVPIVYIYATLQTLPKEWAPGAYDRRLVQWVDGLPDGRLVRCQCEHDIPLATPEVVVREVRRLIA
jgi:pimeloyl-ACP methyl ester carboxylesterase